MTRVLIDPDSLRATARTLNEAASELGLYARSIESPDVYVFAPDIRGSALAVTQSVRRELVAVSSELGQEADDLRTRAARAEERGGGFLLDGVLRNMMLPGARTAQSQGRNWWLAELVRWLPDDGEAARERWGWGLEAAGVVDFVRDVAGRKVLGWRAMYDIRRIGVELTGRDMGLIRRRAKIGPLGILGAGTDAAQLGVDLGAGRYYKIGGDLFKVGTDVLFAAAPRLGLYGAAFSAGMFMGYELDRRFQIGDKASSAIQGSTVSRLYGGKSPNELTVQQATDYSRRYDGPGGFFNFAKDGTLSATQSARSFLGRVF